MIENQQLVKSPTLYNRLIDTDRVDRFRINCKFALSHFLPPTTPRGVQKTRFPVLQPTYSSSHSLKDMQTGRMSIPQGHDKD